MRDWKIIAICAALAFLFSLISGLFGGVSIGVLLFRAILGSTIFGALGFGISIIFRRYLPELFESNSQSTSEIDEDLSQIQKNPDNVDESDGSPVNKPMIDISIEDEVSQPLPAAAGAKIENVLESNINSENELVDELVESKNTEESDENSQIPGNIDALPDMGVFSNSFDNSEDIDGNDSSSSGAVTLDIMGEEQDPELVARAVQTMVKKDQEG